MKILPVFLLFVTSQCFGQLPVNIESDSAEFNQKKGTIVYTGNVSMTQDNKYLQANKLEIDRDKAGKIERVIATGNLATFRTEHNSKQTPLFGQAKRIEYYPQKGVAYLLETASLKQEDKEITGEHLIYYFEEEKLVSQPVPTKRTFVTIISKEQHHETF